ncbi:MAG: DUF2125 domain-containing protein [Pseudomonadota bacterium]
MQTSAADPQGSTKFGRKIRLLALLMVVLALAVTGAWFTAAHFYRGALDSAREALTAQGVEVVCENESFGGFPARFEARCASLRLSFADGSFISGGELQTVAPAWNPLFTITEWTGPFAGRTLDGTPVEVQSDLLRSSVRVNTQARLQRLSVVLDPFAVRLDGASTPILTAEQGELHMRPPVAEDGEAPQGQDDLEIAFVTLGATSPLLAEVDDVNFSTSGVVEGLASVQARSLREAFAVWISQTTGRIDPVNTRLQVGEHAIHLDGATSVNPEGLLSFDGALVTTDVATMLNMVGIDQDGGGAFIIAGISLIGQTTTLNGAPALSIPIQVNEGVVMAGPLEVGLIPPIRF